MRYVSSYATHCFTAARLKLRNEKPKGFGLMGDDPPSPTPDLARMSRIDDVYGQAQVEIGIRVDRWQGKSQTSNRSQKPLQTGNAVPRTQV
jgi:hypothetical protein